MRRLLWFALELAVAILAAVWLAERPGAVTIAWQGWRVDTSVGVLAALVFLAAALAAILYRLWRFLKRAPGQARELSRTRRRAAGYKALTQGMVAVAAGDAEEARRQASRADALLGEPPLSLLLAAQAAQLGGDEDAARRYFEHMLAKPETEFLGLRGLLMQALRAGQRERALALAERARGLRPDSASVLEALFALHAQAGHWLEAQAALDRLNGRRLVKPTEARARHAALLVERSRQAAAAGRAEEALAQARRAHALDPALAPASAALARGLIAAGKTRKAQKLLLAAWALAPQPELATLYGETLPGDPAAPAEGGFARAGALARARGLAKLAAANAGHVESELVLAAAALAAGLWGEARRHLTPLADGGETRAFRLMARLEEGETGNAQRARAWLDRAAVAGSAGEPGWRCGGCGAPAAAWQAVCGACGAFGTLGWGAPASARLAAPTSRRAAPVPA